MFSFEVSFIEDDAHSKPLPCAANAHEGHYDAIQVLLRAGANKLLTTKVGVYPSIGGLDSL